MGNRALKYLVDSNIIIYHLNNEQTATKFLIENFSDCAISIITYIEVLTFDFSFADREKVQALMESFTIFDINKKIAQMALENRQIKKIKIADNLIGSTAQVYNMILVTRNTNDFKTLDLNLLDIFEASDS